MCNKILKFLIKIFKDNLVSKNFIEEESYKNEYQEIIIEY